MAEKKQSKPKDAPDFKLNGLYVKDISFENPGAPDVFFNFPNGQSGKPNIDIKIDLGLAKFANGNYEVALNIVVNAKTETNKTLFLIDLLHAGLFVMNPDLPTESHDRILLVDCATVIFPFARQIIASLIQEGGFPPLLLEPINFETIYRAKRVAAA